MVLDLSKNYRTIMQKIPRQLSESALVENLGSLSESIGPAFKATMATTLVTNLLFAGVLNKFIGAMRPLQIITHLLMFKTIVPANVMIFMESILPITQYDYLEPYWTDFIVNTLRFDVEAQELEKFGGDQDVTDQILTLGYENQSSLLNLGSISFYMLVYSAKMVIFVGVILPLRNKF